MIAYHCQYCQGISQCLQKGVLVFCNYERFYQTRLSNFNKARSKYEQSNLQHAARPSIDHNGWATSICNYMTYTESTATPTLYAPTADFSEDRQKDPLPTVWPAKLPWCLLCVSWAMRGHSNEYRSNNMGVEATSAPVTKNHPAFHGWPRRRGLPLLAINTAALPWYRAFRAYRAAGRLWAWKRHPHQARHAHRQGYGLGCRINWHIIAPPNVST